MNLIRLTQVFVCGVPAVLLLGLASRADAAIYTYNFDTIVTGDVPSGTNIATLQIEDTALDTVLITLSHNATSASGQFITQLFLNLNPFVVPTQSNQTPANKFDGPISASLNGEGTAGLNFDLLQEFQTSNSGGGVNRLKPGESISFNLNATGLDAGDFLFNAIPTGGQRDDVLALIHLQGIPGGGSSKMGVVPEPASLVAVGLGLAALMRRRRNR